MAKGTRLSKFGGAIAYTKTPVAGITILGRESAKTELTLEELIEKYEKGELIAVQKEALMRKMKERIGVVAPATSPKRYLVDPKTGRIDVVEDGEGEYTMKDAVIVSSSLRGDQGQFVGIANLLKELRETERKTEEPQKKKEFYVDDDSGMIVHDPEHGEFTLSEARAISASRQRLLVPKNEPITLERLELLKRDIREEMGKELKGVAQELRPKDDVSPFIFDDKGEMQLNPNARNIPALYYLLFQLIKQGKQSSPAYTDAEGTTMRLPEWLEVKKWQKEEDRKDDRNKALLGLTQTIREHVGDFAEAVRLTAAEVRTKGTANAGETPQPQTFLCGQCKTRFALHPGTELQEGQQLQCPNCRTQSQAFECGQCKARFILPPSAEQLKCPSCGKTWTKEEVIA